MININSKYIQEQSYTHGIYSTIGFVRTPNILESLIKYAKTYTCEKYRESEGLLRVCCTRSKCSFDDLISQLQ